MKGKILRILSIVSRVCSPIIGALITGVPMITTGVTNPFTIGGIVVMIALVLVMKDELLKVNLPSSTLGLGLIIIIINSLFGQLTGIAWGLVIGSCIAWPLEIAYKKLNMPVEITGEIATSLKKIEEYLNGTKPNV